MKFPAGFFAVLPIILALCVLSHAGSEETNRFGGNLLFNGLTYHPGGGSSEDYPRKLDEKAYWVLQLGAEAHGDVYLHKYLLLRGSSGLFRDCEDVWSGFFHLGPRINIPISSKFVFRIGIGPTLVWRETWFGVEKGYRGDSFYGRDSTGDYQSRFIWYGGNLDFEWKVSKNISLIYSNLPGWPYVITSSIGARYSL